LFPAWTQPPRRALFAAGIVILGALAASGCIRRRVIITSDPPEAMVYWNEQYRGRTPIEIPFIWHWKYTVRLEREGCEPFSTVEHLRARPWLMEPLEFFAEALPFRIGDTRKFHYRLDPASEEGAL